MFERFSDSARRAVDVAEEEADGFGHPHIGTEHVLLGLLADGESVAAKVLAEAGVTLDAAREKAIEAVARNRETEEGGLDFTPRARRALGRASRFSFQRLSEQVEPQHVLLGVLDVEGTACQVLRRLGVDVVKLREAVDRTEDKPRSSTLGVVQAPDPVSAALAAVPDESPRCPTCGKDLDTVLAYRLLRAPGEAGGSGRDFFVSYCTACGSALGATPA